MPARTSVSVGLIVAQICRVRRLDSLKVPS